MKNYLRAMPCLKERSPLLLLYRVTTVRVGMAFAMLLSAGVMAQSGAGERSQTADSETAEPSAPDALDIVMVPEGENAVGSLEFDIVVKPAVTAEAELEIADPGGARLKSGQKKRTLSIQRGGAVHRERIKLNVADGKPRTVMVKLHLLGTDGKPWLTLDRAVKVKPEGVAEEPRQRRVPVVHTLPDGSRIVEYITSEEAVSRGLPAEGKPATGTPDK